MVKINTKKSIITISIVACMISTIGLGITDNSLRLSRKLSECRSVTYMPDIKKQIAWQHHVTGISKDMSSYRKAIPLYAFIKENMFKGYDLPDSLKVD